MQTVKDMWDQFEGSVLPKGCHPVQRLETRRAFYAGAWAMFNLSVQAADETPDTEAGEAVGAELMDRLHKECLAFKDMVEAGLA